MLMLSAESSNGSPSSDGFDRWHLCLKHVSSHELDPEVVRTKTERAKYFQSRLILTRVAVALTSALLLYFLYLRATTAGSSLTQVGLIFVAWVYAIYLNRPMKYALAKVEPFSNAVRVDRFERDAEAARLDLREYDDADLDSEDMLKEEFDSLRDLESIEVIAGTITMVSKNGQQLVPQSVAIYRVAKVPKSSEPSRELNVHEREELRRLVWDRGGAAFYTTGTGALLTAAGIWAISSLACLAAVLLFFGLMFIAAAIGVWKDFMRMRVDLGKGVLTLAGDTYQLTSGEPWCTGATPSPWRRGV